MELSSLLLLPALLICLISTGITMWRMNINMEDRQMHLKPGGSAHPDQIQKSEE